MGLLGQNQPNWPLKCWRRVKTRYDDDGLSGGSLERPALQAFLWDIVSERIESSFSTRSTIQMIARGQALKDRWFASPDKTIAQIADEEGVNPGEASRLVRLAFLGPEIVEAVLRGDQSVSVSARELRRVESMPSCWRAQARALLSGSN